MCSQSELQTVNRSVVKASVELLEDKIYKIILYGSYARGDFDSESDIDIMILLDCTSEEVKKYRKLINKLASRIGLENDIEVSLVVRDRTSFEERLNLLLFYQKVQKEDVEEQIANAEKFCEAVQGYLRVKSGQK